MHENKLKILGGILVAIMIANVVFFALRKISPLFFWTVIIIMAFLAWRVVPKMKENSQQKE